ncbi:replicative DNA helicase [Emticicia sp. SJ17W-69]|uniref:replicative DNA helicase n=1 Tax=Emticicia sp. SJ17W-69 TaxID=3421657 RepID=UPI003EBD0AF9
MEKSYQNNPVNANQNQRGFGKNLFLETLRSESGKLPPQAVELEEAVLGALMIEKDALTAVVDILQDSSFYKESHQRIYKAIISLFGKSEPIDMLTVTTQLRSTGELEFVGGASYLVKLTNKVNSAANIEYHARIITQSAIKRDMIKIAGEILKDAYEDTTDVFNLLDKIEQNFFEISERNIRKNYADASTIMRATIEELEKKKNNKDGLTGVASGFTELDRITSGWQNTELTIIAARPAMGKCLGKGTKVLMYDGTLKKVEDVEKGDLLMGDDSTPRNVLSIARGQEKMYWIRQNKAIDYRVNESHILSLKRSRNEGKYKKGEVLNITVKDYLDKSDKFKSNYKGYKVEIDFEERNLELEPYFLGLWLGDGHSYSSRITNIDTEVVGFLGEYAEKLELELVEYSQVGKTPNYGITKGFQGKQDFYSIQHELRELNLLQNKHIPQHYLINSKENRLQLLAGLLDSDGNYDEKFNCFEISQKNENLAHQIKFLCDSLGFRTSIKKKKTTIKALNFEGTTFRVRIFGNLDSIPTRIERKKARQLKAKADWRVTGIKVEFDKVDDYYGFEIDGNHLFLLEDMTVTHNTAFVVSAMRNAAVEWNIPVAMFSLEMSATQLMLRLISAEAEIDSNKLRKGKLENHEWVQLHQKIKNLSNAPIYIDDTPALSILEMRAKCRRLKAQFDIGLVIIDYLQLMTADTGSGGKGNREQEIAAISRAMKNLAKEINVPVIALSQLSRAVETRGGDKRPQLSDLRESGSIEQDADMVMFLYRPEYYKITQDEQGNSTEGVGEVIIAKNRSGDVDTVKLRFIGKYTKFTDLDGFYTPLPGQDNFGDFNIPKPIISANSLENFESSAPSSMPSPNIGGTVTLGSKANQARNLDDEKEFPF